MHTVTHRRAFLGQLAAIVGAGELASLVARDGAFGTELDAAAAAAARGFPTLRDRYLLDPKVVYFNHGSIGTIPRAVHEARLAYLALCETNPWLFMWGGRWEEPREAVRAKAGSLLGAAPADVAFTHNTTEGFNVLAHGLPLGPGDEVVFSTLNHDGASTPWFHTAQQRGFTVTRFTFPIADVPRMTARDVLDTYDRHITPRTRVLVFAQVDNLLGLRYPVRELAALAHAKGVRIVAVDGAQATGMLPVDVGAMGIDVYCTSPHKWLQAPKGLGLMYLSPAVRDVLRPMWVTWGQRTESWQGTARLFEDYGTRNVAEVLALGDAIDFQNALGAEAKEARYRAMWETFRRRAATAVGVAWRSPEAWELSASLYALEVEGQDSRRVFERMYERHGFVFRPFHSADVNTIRISPNVYNTDEEIDRFFEVLREA